MKRKILVNMVLISLLFGCNKKKVEYDFSIISPTGAAAVAFYNYADNSKYETTSAISNIPNMMVNGSKDIIVIDTSTGIQQIKNGAKYSLAAGLTFGNFFVYSVNGGTQLNITSSSKIYSFGAGQVPDKTFKALFPNMSEANIEYSTNGAAGTNAVMCNGKLGGENIDYVFTAQPVLQAVLNNASCTTSKQYFSAQDIYKEKFGKQGFPQAGLFVKNSIIEERKSELNQFLKDLKSDIEKGINNPDLIEEGMSKNDEATSIYGVSAVLAKQITANQNGLGLGFKYGGDIKTEIEEYFTNINASLGTLENSYFYKP